MFTTLLRFLILASQLPFHRILSTTNAPKQPPSSFQKVRETCPTILSAKAPEARYSEASLNLSKTAKLEDCPSPKYLLHKNTLQDIFRTPFDVVSDKSDEEDSSDALHHSDVPALIAEYASL
jgi:hypothetical protein